MPQDIKDTLDELTHERDIKLEINNDVNKLGYLNRELILEPASSWSFLPLDTTENETTFYNNIAERLAPRFPGMKILNNENYVYDGVRYIALLYLLNSQEEKKKFKNILFRN